MAYKNKEDQQRNWREHYARNKERYFERNKRRRQEMAEFVNELKDKPCTDCGVQYHPFVMDFDHREGGDKRANVSYLARIGGASKKTIMAEIAKCDLVCSNCHRLRTLARFGDAYNRQD